MASEAIEQSVDEGTCRTGSDFANATYDSLARQAKLLREAATKLKGTDAELAAACVFGASIIDEMADPVASMR